MAKHGLLIGVGIDDYSDNLPRLVQAVADVRAVAEKFESSYDGEPLVNVLTDGE